MLIKSVSCAAAAAAGVRARARTYVRACAESDRARLTPKLPRAVYTPVDRATRDTIASMLLHFQTPLST